MLKVGLTGNIGSGKSIISKIFSIYGVPVYHADQESGKFLSDPFVKEKIVSFFGETILNTTGEIDKHSLADSVFSDKEKLMKLNSILHPLVVSDFLNWCRTFDKVPYIIQEAAIIYESGVAGIFDKIIHVSCPKEVAIERVVKRDGTDADRVLKRMQFQMKDEEKAGLADFVILNDGIEMILPQITSIHEKLTVISAQH
jgi:dephospho-CoA kinase